MKLTKFQRLLSIVALMSAALVPTKALAYDWGVLVPVTSVEASYMPTVVLFSTNVALGTCPAGSWIKWESTTNPDGVKAVFALLLAAKITGTPVFAYGVNAGCALQYIHLG
jgi:hypothetical protein